MQSRLRRFLQMPQGSRLHPRQMPCIMRRKNKKKRRSKAACVGRCAKGLKWWHRTSIEAWVCYFEFGETGRRACQKLGTELTLKHTDGKITTEECCRTAYCCGHAMRSNVCGYGECCKNCRRKRRELLQLQNFYLEDGSSSLGVSMEEFEEEKRRYLQQCEAGDDERPPETSKTSRLPKQKASPVHRHREHANGNNGYSFLGRHLQDEEECCEGEKKCPDSGECISEEQCCADQKLCLDGSCVDDDGECKKTEAPSKAPTRSPSAKPVTQSPTKEENCEDGGTYCPGTSVTCVNNECKRWCGAGGQYCDPIVHGEYKHCRGGKCVLHVCCGFNKIFTDKPGTCLGSVEGCIGYYESLRSNLCDSQPDFNPSCCEEGCKYCKFNGPLWSDCQPV